MLSANCLTDDSSIAQNSLLSAYSSFRLLEKSKQTKWNNSNSANHEPPVRSAPFWKELYSKGMYVRQIGT